MTGAVATAAYREVLPPELTGPDHPEWFAARQAGISASEIAAVLGISPWESPFSLWHRKAGTVGEQAGNDEMRWGSRVEAAIADEWGDLHPDFFVRPAGLYTSAARPWQLASPDRLLLDRSLMDLGMSVDAVTVAVLEAKNSASYDEWGDEGSDVIPVHYRAQVLWQCDVLGVEVGYVAAVIGGRPPRTFVIRVDEAADEIALMRDAAERFLAGVAAGQAPGIDEHTATLAALKELHPDLDGTDAEVPADVADAYRAACAAAKAADAAKKLAENQLRDAMGRSRRALDPLGSRVATRSIYEVAEHVRRASTTDKLVPAKQAATTAKTVTQAAAKETP